jgi:peptide/nickel transport system ATP-binding protein
MPWTRAVTAAEPLLTVRNLSVDFGRVAAVRDVSFSLGREKLAIVGESGSGKSTIGRAIVKLHPPGCIRADELSFGNRDLLRASEKQMLGMRGKEIAMILQDPKFSLNPVMKVGDQISEAYRAHRRSSAAEAREKSLAMLEMVRINDPRRVYEQYPHQMSGGMGQRIMIAMMLLPEPRLVIADEPTSALDVTVRLQVLALLDDLVTARGLGLIFITHDLNLVRSFCDRVLIMYAGRIVEEIAAAELDRAEHPYSRGLLQSLPDIDRRRERLPVLRRDPAWLET